MPTTPRIVLSLLAAAALAAPAAALASAHTYPCGGYAHLPMAFESNLGQTDSSVDFLARGNGYGMFLSGGDALLTLGDNQTCLDPAGFVAKLNPTATGLVFAGCMDAPGKDGILGLAIDRAENVYVTGFTLSPKFPVVDAFQST